MVFPSSIHEQKLKSWKMMVNSQIANPNHEISWVIDGKSIFQDSLVFPGIIPCFVHRLRMILMVGSVMLQIRAPDTLCTGLSQSNFWLVITCSANTFWYSFSPITLRKRGSPHSNSMSSNPRANSLFLTILFFEKIFFLKP